MNNIFKELQQRKVIRVGGAYLVAGWIVMQVLEVMVPALHLPASVNTIAAVILLAGFPIAVLLSWVFEITPEGIKLDGKAAPGERFSAETRKKMDYIIYGGLAVVLVLIIAQNTFLSGDGQAEMTAEESDADNGIEGTRAELADLPADVDLAEAPKLGLPPIPEKSVAVLPFATRSAGTDDGYFADGLSEEIIVALTAVPDLLVTARGSAFFFKGKNVALPEVARTLRVAHIVDGSVRRDGNRARITAQLVRASDGFTLWSETYDRKLDDVFAVQINIAENVAKALGIILDDELRNLMLDVGIGDVDAFIAYQRGLDFYARAHGDDPLQPTLVSANAEFDIVVANNSDFSQAYLRQADLYAHILMDKVPFQGELFVSEVGISAKEALDHIGADLDAAFHAEHDIDQKLMIQANRIFLSPNWSGLGSTMDKALSQAHGCTSDLWMSDIGPIFGRAEETLEWNKSRMHCDRLDAAIRTFAAFSAVMLGRHDEALQYIQDQEDLLGPRERDTTLQLQALLAAKRYDEANMLYDSIEPSGMITVQVPAAQGRQEDADTALQKMLADEDLAVWVELPVVAVSGDLEEANRLAAAIDVTPLGPAILSAATSLCLCGSPFDLQKTPNFKRQLEQADLPWPPPSPIDWPLKKPDAALPGSGH